MMKRLGAFLLAGLLLLTAGCSNWVRDDYLSVSGHVEQATTPTLPTEEVPPPTVSDRTELRGAVLTFVRDWVENGTILVRDYDGDILADLSDTLRYVTEEDPIGAYAVDYADAELDGDGKSGSVSLRIVFRRSAAEIDSIVTVYGNEAAYQKIASALENFDTALTLRIRSYEDTDFAAYIRRFCLENPSRCFALPELSAAIYPAQGRTRILELHLLYPAARDEMRRMQDSVNTLLTSAASYIRSGATDRSRLELLCRFLTTRFAYTIREQEPTTPAYSLLCDGVAHSLSFASVFYAECAAVELDCQIVSGTRNGAAHYWNLLCLDGVYYYVDLLREIEREETGLILLTAQELEDEGYIWQREDYPPTPEPTEPSAENGGDAGGTESSEPPIPSTEPTESTEPTDPTGESSQTDPSEQTEEPTTEPTEESSAR